MAIDAGDLNREVLADLCAVFPTGKYFRALLLSILLRCIDVITYCVISINVITLETMRS